MGMVVRSNIMAINANRQLGMNNSQVGKSLEKLASGYRINRAGDDASGLAISEKMKAQIRGLETASANSQDGISLVQTAEGALTEVHDMLNRMVELAGKSANGTMDDNVDRKSLQKEMDALKDEINRIAEGTNFNGTKLLDGSLGSVGKATLSAATIGGAPAAISTAPATASKFTGVASTAFTDGNATFTYTDATGATKTIGITGLTGATATLYGQSAVDALNANADFKANFKAELDGSDNIIITGLRSGSSAPQAVSLESPSGDITGGTAVNGTDEITSANFSALAAGDSFTVNGKTYEMIAAGGKAKTGNIGVEFTTDLAGSLTAINAALKENGVLATNNGGVLSFAVDPDAVGKGLTLQVGDTADPFNKVTVKIDNMGCVGLGIDQISVADQDSASAALELLKNSQGGGAINIVSSTRADLGALQNRLEHTINNLDVAAENMSAANSRIRDTDMAKQMMEYTKMNVLTQAAQAMLAQANAQPQSILQLLQ